MKDKLDQVLAEVRKEHREISAPAGIESRLRAFAASGRSVAPVRHLGWAAAAALVIGAIAWQAVRVVPLAHSAPSAAARAEVATDFITLPGTESLPAAVQVSILRMELSKGDLRPYGFDIPPGVAGERVRADFVIGDDGLARAVRLVQ